MKKKKRLKWCQYCRGPVNQASMGLRAVGRAVDAPQREASPSVSTENFRGSAHSTDAIDAISKHSSKNFASDFFLQARRRL